MRTGGENHLHQQALESDAEAECAAGQLTTCPRPARAWLQPEGPSSSRQGRGAVTWRMQGAKHHASTYPPFVFKHCSHKVNV